MDWTKTRSERIPSTGTSEPVLMRRYSRKGHNEHQTEGSTGCTCNPGSHRSDSHSLDCHRQRTSMGRWIMGNRPVPLSSFRVLTLGHLQLTHHTQGVNNVIHLKPRSNHVRRYGRPGGRRHVQSCLCEIAGGYIC